MNAAVLQLLRYLPDPWARQVLYRETHGRPGNFSRPKRFTEFVNRRALYERTERLAWTGDKLRTKAFVRERCHRMNVPAVLWIGRNLAGLETSALPDRWILKPNHRRSLMYLGSERSELADVQAATAGWLDSDESFRLGEWAYGRAEPTLIVEQHLEPENQESLSQYRFFVFHGEVRLVSVEQGIEGVRRESFYTPQWRRLAVSMGKPPLGSRLPPDRWNDMLFYAAELARDFDFMRVDLYAAERRIWFSGLDPYPAGGLAVFEPDSLDLQMGAWWARGEVPPEHVVVQP